MDNQEQGQEDLYGKGWAMMEEFLKAHGKEVAVGAWLIVVLIGMIYAAIKDRRTPNDCPYEF